ncbi:hypothetical protein [Nonomuraea harbinensis]|uniref:Uncharacterized protein n=1 Tax=Nonomuraea harbinensis TaxID=1286938 RepID=A0ABW1C6X4_9ACTN|nr:hypothetical protein [Nonomuraea harbinensis]
MRRFRFGWIAAPIAVAFGGAAVVAGVFALVTGDAAVLRALVAHGWGTDMVPYTWWVEVILAGGGILTGWALWQILRGRRAGEAPVLARPVRLLRAALYVSLACALAYEAPIPYQWWLDLPGTLTQFAIVWLFLVVLAGSIPRWLRIVALVAGLADTAVDLVAIVAYGLGQYWDLPPLGNVLYLLWVVPVLIGQARDGRWSRGTVRAGMVAAVLASLSSGSFMIVGFGGTADHGTVILMVRTILSVFALIWMARTAHELAGPPPEPSTCRGERAAARPWPLAAVAVVLPSVPAAVNLAQGMPFWIGPRGAVDMFFREYSSHPAGLAWVAVDVLVGVGAPAVLVLVAVIRRSRRLLTGTMLFLALAAAAGVVTALTARPEEDWQVVPEMAEVRLAVYPDGQFGGGLDGQLVFGLSPLWYSAALAVSALVLFLLYAAPPAARRGRRVFAMALATAVALVFVPAADRSQGTVTTAADCSPPDRRQTGVEPAPLTGERAFICEVRTGQVLDIPATMPDQALLAYGRSLCGVYTRDDPRELARVESVEGLRVRDLYWAIDDICPAAAAKVKTEREADDQEFAAFQAEERAKCAATPRHRPLIEPVKAVRLDDPVWPETGLEMRDTAGIGDSGGGRHDDLVESGPGHLTVSVDSEYHLCVTLETYSRRPPVETKGWDHVTEAGYTSTDGELVFHDVLAGIVLPDLSPGGRRGRYRIRVHHAWFPWKGEERGTQRLLIMAYPGKDDKLVTYRRPAGSR